MYLAGGKRGAIVAMTKKTKTVVTYGVVGGARAGLFAIGWKYRLRIPGLKRLFGVTVGT